MATTGSKGTRPKRVEGFRRWPMFLREYKGLNPPMISSLLNKQQLNLKFGKRLLFIKSLTLKLKKSALSGLCGCDLIDSGLAT